MRSLKERDGQIINNWYIACLSKELGSKPHSITIYDENLVIFRDRNHKIQCYPNRCPHRGTPLSYGRCTPQGLQCCYHGWTFDKGELVHVPSEGELPPKGKRDLRQYPCVEKDNVIWVWMGEGLPKSRPQWDFPYMHEKKWHYYFMVANFENEVTHLAENFVDVPHTIWVHKGWFRNRTYQKVPAIVTTENGKVLMEYLQEHDSIGVLIRPFLNPKNEPMFHTDQFIYPNITRVDYSFGSHFKYVINSQITPVSNFKSRVYTYIAYQIPLIGTLIKSPLRLYTRQVLEQDIVIMKQQSENLRDEDTPRFQSTPADEPHLQIERLRNTGINDQEAVFSLSKKREISFFI